jgi:hypothetical protein
VLLLFIKKKFENTEAGLLNHYKLPEGKRTPFGDQQLIPDAGAGGGRSGEGAARVVGGGIGCGGGRRN